MKLFTKERNLTPSWELVNPNIELVKKHFWPVFYLSFLPGLLLNICADALKPDAIIWNDSRTQFFIFLLVVSVIWSVLVYPAFVYLQTQAIQGRHVTATQAFSKGLERLLPLFGATILVGLIVFLGFIALVIPGLIFLRMFFLVPYYVVDQKLGPIDAMRQSYEATKPVTAWVWGIIGVSFVFSIAAGLIGIIPYIGVVISSVITLAYVFVPALRYGEITNRVKVLPKA